MIQRERQINIKPQKARVQQSGFTLLETLIAIFIFSLALVSLMTIASSGISATRSAIEQTTAQFLAQEGIELIQNKRDSNLLALGTPWNDGIIECVVGANNVGCRVSPHEASGAEVITGCGASCPPLRLQSVGFYNYSNGDTSKYTRTVSLRPLVDGSTYEYLLTSEVSWPEGGGTRNVVVSKNIFDWLGAQEEPVGGN